MGFRQHINYPGGNTTLGSAYTAGSGSFTLATGTGAAFLAGVTPTTTNPLRFTVAYAATPGICTDYECTGASGDTLTGVTVLDGTDRNYSVGDTVYSSVYAEDLNDLQSAATSLQTGQAGMFWSVAVTSDRDAIPTSVRVEGMQVFTQDTQIYWSLLPPPWTGTGTDWIESAPVVIDHNGTAVGSRETINFIDGAGVTLTVADNPTSDRVDVTIAASGGGGTVTSVSVATANGFGGTVATATTTPAITLTTSVTGILKGNGTGVSAAVAGTDYLASNQTITLSGDVTGSGSTAITTTVGAINGAALGTTTATAGHLLVGTGTAWATQAVSGDASLSSGGALTVGSIGGKAVSLGGSLTTSGAYSLTITCTANTSVTLPTSGTLVNTSVATLSSLASVGTITTGTWQATAIAPAYLTPLGASGASHSAGICPDPGATAGTTRYLREDATWDVPSGGGSYAPARNFETSSGSMTIPSTATILRVSAISAGASGGSGARQPSGTAAYGGGGGGGGSAVLGLTYAVSDLLALGSTLTWSIGAPGAAVAPPATDSTNGNNGNGSGNLTVSVGATTILELYGASGGSGGTTTSSSGGSSTWGSGQMTGTSGGSSSVTAAAGNGGNSGETNSGGGLAGAGGGAGGGLSAAGTPYNGGNGGMTTWPLPRVQTGGYGTGGTTGTSGGNGSGGITAFSDLVMPGCGGGGGGACSATTGVPGSGGAGGNYGAGGGGGGAMINGVTLTGTDGYSGAGGPGCLLLEWF